MARLAGQESPEFSCLCLPALGLRFPPPYSAYYMSTEDLNSGPDAYMASTLPTKSSPLPCPLLPSYRRRPPNTYVCRQPGITRRAQEHGTPGFQGQSRTFRGWCHRPHGQPEGCQHLRFWWWGGRGCQMTPCLPSRYTPRMVLSTTSEEPINLFSVQAEWRLVSCPSPLGGSVPLAIASSPRHLG